MDIKIIEISDLYKSFGVIKAVDGINLSVYKGDIFGFLGPNGAGKSTTIRMLLSLIYPDKGSIKIFGKELFQNRIEILKKIGALIERPNFYEYLSAYRNLEILAKYSKINTSKNKIFEILEFVGLKDRIHSKVSTFSQGMKQRLGLAQAILSDPDLIILDEPLNGLDPQGIKDIRNLILFLNKECGKTIFLSSHILHEIELISSRLVIINKGKTIIEGNVSDLLQNGDMRVSVYVKNINDAFDFIKSSSFINLFENRENDILYFKMKKDDIPKLNRYLTEKGIDIFSIKSVNTLEDYFINITEA
jgi:ABC-type multidrug transport system ATPase subunit